MIKKLSYIDQRDDDGNQS